MYQHPGLDGMAQKGSSCVLSAAHENALFPGRTWSRLNMTGDIGW